MPIQARIGEVTERIVARSRRRRAAISNASTRRCRKAPARKKLGCANFAHGFAACAPGDKAALRDGDGAESRHRHRLQRHAVGASALRALPRTHQARRARGGRARAQVAGGVPAMCDGVTQGEAGMELSLFSRDVIALSTAVALSHQMFDAAVYLGVCDKIVPGLLIGALSFGHLPAVFVPAGPMTSGLVQRREVEDPPALRRGQGRRAPSCWRPRRRPITRRAPAPSTAPPTPTRC